MIGKVRSISKTNAAIAVETTGGQITVVDPLDPISVSIGDVIRGDLESLGRETLKVAGGAEFECLIRAIHCSPAEAAKWLRG
jgi:hypothetical protein